jgi:hemoglobin/transferrin/lactoferrin receptor protein
MSRFILEVLETMKILFAINISILCSAFPLLAEDLKVALEICHNRAVETPFCAGKQIKECSTSGVAVDLESCENACRAGVCRLEPAVTTSTRGLIPALASDRSQTILGKGDLKLEGDHSLVGALEGRPSSAIQSTNRGAAAPVLRGAIGPQNLITIDGLRFNQSTFRTGPNQYLTTISPWAFQKLEVVRGPGGVLYGSGAIGGVLGLLTIDPRQAPKTRAQASYGWADNTMGTALQSTGVTESAAVSLGGGFSLHDDLRVGNRSSGGATLVLPSLDNGQLRGTSYNRYHWNGQVTKDVTTNSSVNLRYLGGWLSDAPRQDRLGRGEVRLYDNRDDFLALTYRYDGTDWFDDISLSLLSHQTSETVERWNCFRSGLYNPVRSPIGCALGDSTEIDRRRKLVDQVDTLGIQAIWASRLPDQNLILRWGIEDYRDDVTSTRVDARAPDWEESSRRGNFADGSTYDTLGVFFFGEWSPLQNKTHEVILRAGTRMENFSADAMNVSDELGDVHYSHTGLVGSAGITYLLEDRLSLYSNWSQGFRAPNLQETTVLGDTGNFFEIPNPDLGPEKADNLEVGARIDWRDIARIELSGWTTLLTDNIVRETASWKGEDTVDDKEVRRRTNRDTAYFVGADARLETYPLVADIRGELEVSWIDGAVEADGEDTTFVSGPLHSLIGDEAKDYENPRRLPPLMWSAGVRWKPSRTWYGRLWTEGARSQPKLSPGDASDLRICEAQTGVLYGELGADCPGTNGWTTYNAAAGLLVDDFQVEITAKNLLDLRYRRHGSGVPSSGFNALVTVSYKR